MLGPVKVDNRIQSLDVARAIALFGILLMNITAFGLPHAYSDPTTGPGSSPACSSRGPSGAPTGMA